MPTDVYIENRRGEQLVGTLARSGGRPATAGAGPAAGKRLCILCHGFHADRNYHLLRKVRARRRPGADADARPRRPRGARRARRR